ncbi:MAG: hypothetical protein H6736_06155 [Alphaproteobacteria bacterium]|nr:hypothetical protein [Alphaproteobacteria bacterium]MCB9691383.1 hypothetical protein [Alphaproteobacteria bacterium]
MIVLLLACHDDPVQPLLATGWFDDTGSDAGCAHLVQSTEPGPGATGWYHRDPLRVRTSTSARGRYEARLLGPDGLPVPTTTAWTDGLAFHVVPDAPLAPDAPHVLEVTDCEERREVPFTTSGLGLPLTDGPAGLVDGTWDLDMRNATWREPNGVGPLLSLYFDAPVLLGVRAADASSLQVALTIGLTTTDGASVQDPLEPVIPFPPTPFTGAPYFEASVGRVSLNIGGAPVPVNAFAFSGTFSADGQRIGGGTLVGLADTRYAGVLLSSDRAEAVCELGEGLGVTCADCPDGEPYCLTIDVVDIEGTRVPGLVLQER